MENITIGIVDGIEYVMSKQDYELVFNTEQQIIDNIYNDPIKKIVNEFNVKESILYKPKRKRPITRNKRKHIKPNEHRINKSC